MAKRQKSPSLKLLISNGGKIQSIYSDSLLPLTKLGHTKTKRASHVEPEEDGSGWVATIIGGPKLGPYLTRAEALAAEVKYLEEKMFK